MLAQYLDLSLELNKNNFAIVELSNWDYCVIQVVNPSGTINLTATNDSGAVQGQTDGNYKLSTNYTTIQATKLSDGTDVTALATAGQYRVDVVGRYLKIGGASAAATKLLIMLAKIS
jgi:hypothetical protein